ncbi:hypothetical protein ONS95_009647 [Cadophora gregata]|uniref:uncharacterized protein n=1 Tax=Cadophora gregata TaxID=51156 RepID=UPI0026DC8818|nr:uncharacterized protein ONS95_009647 [Cadophora gregata]KAK0124704.1 hypothetical protein ONS95_009647 [Cadophora gregata]KAK0129436.1 hypothetical protein ONS96_000009 [Cadophora gregata f. sp. sojae]
MGVVDATSANEVRDIIPKDYCWKFFAHLSLQANLTTEADLQDMLLRHAPTLRSLELRDVFLHAESPSSWISIFQFLRRNMDLKTVMFSDSLYNGRYEDWRISDHHKDDDQSVFPKSCIGSQVEQNVTNQITIFPFSLFPGGTGTGASVTFGLEGQRRSWADTDESWMTVIRH